MPKIKEDNSSTPENVDILIGQKLIRAYVTAAIVALKMGAEFLTIKARGRSISKAVDLAEILKRFENPSLTLYGKIVTGTESFKVEGQDRERKVSTIEIVLERGSNQE